jgi:hypothetical protein
MNSATPLVPATVGAQQAAPLLGTMSNSIVQSIWSAAVCRRFSGVIHPPNPAAREATPLSDLRAPSAPSVLNSEAFSSPRPLRASSALSALKIFNLSL